MAGPGEKASKKVLVAAFPGMGNVSVIAAGYLIQKFGYAPVAELPPKGYFDIGTVHVHGGRIEQPRMPRGVIFRAPAGSPLSHVTLFLAESQPNSGMWAYALELLERAAGFGADRVVTFAALAAQIDPRDQPKVFGVANRESLLEEFDRLEVRAVQEGQIAGMNGVMLGAAADRDIEAMCLMAEIPFFAAGVPNPKASKAVLETFGLMAGVDIDLANLARDAERTEPLLVRLMEKLQSQGEGEEEGEEEFSSEEDESPRAASGGGGTGGGGAGSPLEKLTKADRDRIEELFESAKQDRQQTIALKNELDRLGVFPLYENRFLDLFKRAE
ncbi:MAG: PAC2 family protein [Phycisphaerales bacterium]|nr:PAC2 family protein [Phycisphaerales bacterium]